MGTNNVQAHHQTDQLEIDYEFLPLLRVYKNGHVQRLMGTDSIPPATDPQTNVSSKDTFNIVPQTEVYVRIYLPNNIVTNYHNRHRKLPLLFYIHGGAFCISTPSSLKYHNYLNTLVAEAQIISVSIHHRRAPEYPLPIAYEDSWAALKWVASHRNYGPEPWLNSHADFGRVFVAGDSSGANIAHNVVVAAGVNPELDLGLDLLGLAVVHQYFWGSDPIGSESLDPERKASVDRLWPMVCPSNPDHDDPRVNPMVDGGKSLVGLGCRRVLVCVAEKDTLKDRGWLYYQSEKAQVLIKRLAAFFNRDMPPLVR
ncbi:hypothetical protein ACH5RR_035020 [Cinchona calisaya]|uniref:Alpha/beta hydrolase fold-3 domain-containing protein n=1 Tax=Cinchona calisaya TaxID=153742 RepID=A0ABD2YGK0_9GENT